MTNTTIPIEELSLSPVPPPAADGGDDDDTEFSTPKAKQHLIPDPMTCPPAPVKATGKRKISASAIRNVARRFRKVSKLILSPEVDAAPASPPATRAPKVFR
ncbi:hypothetical protein LINPERHAP2_LOCUS44992 [Linum perenne]